MLESECRQLQIPIGKSKDITGHKFNMLTPRFRVKHADSHDAYWACQCDCGEWVIAKARQLQVGNRKTCGNHKYKDLSGVRFGKLVAIRKVENNSKGRVQWYCKCDCGNDCIVTTDVLQAGGKSTCGCGYRQDLIGQKFGELTVIDYDKSVGRWVCMCSCGEYCNVKTHELTHNKTVKCNNHVINTMIGDTYGELTVLSHTRTHNHKAYFLCQCSCGTITEIRGNNLRQGTTTSCGCLCSVGESNIRSILDSSNIDYVQHKSFDTCRYPDTNEMGQFDFFIHDGNILIEFDGKQHFGYKNKGWDSRENYLTIHNHDLYKNQWAWDNNIVMKRIPYTYRDKLTFDIIMSDEFTITPKTHPHWYPDFKSSYPYCI